MQARRANIKKSQITPVNLRNEWWENKQPEVMMEKKFKERIPVMWVQQNHPYLGFLELRRKSYFVTQLSQTSEDRLTVALSKTLMEFSSATFLFRRASSSVQSGRVSHFPKTTRSISLVEKKRDRKLLDAVADKVNQKNKSHQRQISGPRHYT